MQVNFVEKKLSHHRLGTKKEEKEEEEEERMNDSFHFLPIATALLAMIRKILQRKASHNIGKYDFFFQRENSSPIDPYSPASKSETLQVLKV